ncbi:MAG: carboxylating nicotinate-nucleotide diphosphorylase [Oligoflexia bacterium]|nr:carboxylating nicotinate-nucleotide diphosphorylase [Oligoflexia bacterium]
MFSFWQQKDPFNSEPVRQLVRLAIAEDLAAGDLTSRLVFGDDRRELTAFLLTKERLSVCGLPIVPVVFEELKCRAEVEIQVAEGSVQRSGARLLTLRAAVTDILAAERIILNFIQHLSGVASAAAELLRSAEGIKVLDTRKTTPGWRALEKYAVRVGGGLNHRANLAEMVLIKNNHIDAVRMLNKTSLPELLERIRRNKSSAVPWEIEVRDLAELEAALRADPDVVMLDNMSDEMISEAIMLAQKSGSKALIEVSGGIAADRLPSLAKRGVQYVSVGRLTHSAQAKDISLRFEVAG